MTVFAPDDPGKPGPRIHNEQLERYADYRRDDGTTLGDMQYLAFTEQMTEQC